jgi:hypothetical protein
VGLGFLGFIASIRTLTNKLIAQSLINLEKIYNIKYESKTFAKSMTRWVWWNLKPKFKCAPIPTYNLYLPFNLKAPYSTIDIRTCFINNLSIVCQNWITQITLILLVPKCQVLNIYTRPPSFLKTLLT